MPVDTSAIKKARRQISGILSSEEGIRKIVRSKGCTNFESICHSCCMNVAKKKQDVEVVHLS